MLASAAAVCASVAAWCSLGTLTLATGTAGGQRIGMLPPLWVLGAFLFVSVAAVLALRPHRDVVLPWFLSGLFVVPWLPVPVPTLLLAASGPVTFLAWAAIAGASVAARLALHDRSGGRHIESADGRGALGAAALACAVYVLASWHVSPVLPGGDEPHYLIITQSLLSDGDLRIENNHARGDYASYFNGVLRPDYLRRGQDREIYSIHLPGVSVLTAPAFAVGGYAGVRLWLALLAALAAGLAWRASRQVSRGAGAAWFGTIGAALTAPFLFLSFTVYPDGPGGVVVMAAFAMLASAQPGAFRPIRWWAGAGVLAALLPWLHPRFAVLAAALGIVFAGRALAAPIRMRAIGAFALAPLASATAWFGYYVVIYGSPNPSVAYGHYTQMAAANAVRGLAGLLFDQQFGLVATAPVFAVACVGLVPFVRLHRRLALEWLVIVAPYAFVTAMYHMWWGGQSSPARFLGPVMLLGAVPMAVAWRHAASPAGRALQVMTLGVSLALAALFVGVDHGRFAYTFRDGFALWAVWASTLADVPRALPSWFRSGPNAGLAAAAAWVIAGGAAWAAARWLSARWGRHSGAAALWPAVCAAAGALAATGAAWHIDGANGLAPTTGQLSLIRDLASDRVPLTVSYDPLRLGEGRELAGRVRLGGGRVAGAPADAWLWLPNLPAGRYRLWIDNRQADASFDIEIAIGRSTSPAMVWPLRRARPGPQSLDVELPVDVHSLAVRGPEPVRGTVRGIWIQPVAVMSPRDRVTDERALAARRYGEHTTIWATGDGVYLEDDGLWIAAESDADLVVTGAPGGQMMLRAGPVPLRASVSSGTFRTEVALDSGESRPVAIPGAPGRPALIRIRTDTGFRPSAVDSASTDDRYLGVWVSFPDG